MPKNKRESLIYTVLMCFTMVLWMSVYNVALQHGELSMVALRNAWLGFPIAYMFAMICDWFLVSPAWQRGSRSVSGKAGHFRKEALSPNRKKRQKIRPASMGNGRSS